MRESFPVEGLAWRRHTSGNKLGIFKNLKEVPSLMALLQSALSKNLSLRD